MKFLKFKIRFSGMNLVIYKTCLGALITCCLVQIVTSKEGSESHKEPISLHEHESMSKSQIEPYPDPVKRSKYKLKGRRDQDKHKTPQVSSSTSPTDSSEILFTQLFTKWMSYDTPVTKTEVSKSLKKTPQLFAYGKKLVELLSSKVKQWLSTESESSTGRTFLLGPLLTAIPIMAMEIFAIGGLGLLIPVTGILFFLILPLIAVAFVIFL